MRLLAATPLLLAMDLPARAACPQNLSDCLGAATTFSIVAENAILTKGILGESGEGVTGGGTLNTGYVDPRILSPEGTVIARVNGSVSGGAYARRVDVRGGYAL